jgi:curli biogenesis system outer membrane secretion channel CsgG
MVMSTIRDGRRTLVVISAASLALALGAPQASPQNLDVQLKPVVDKIVAGCSTAGAKRITVADFTDLQGQVTELGRFVAEELGGSLVEASPPFGVVDRANLRMIMAEHKLSMSGLVNPDTAKKLGQIAGVDGIVTGTITPLGDTVRLAVKVVSTETATVMASGRTELAKTKALEDLLGRGVQGAGTAGSGGAGSPSSPATAQPPGAQPTQAVFENNQLRLTVRSLKRRGSQAVMSVRVDGKRAEPFGFRCSPLDLVDENGLRWGGYGGNGLVSVFDWLQLVPGTPSLESVDFDGTQSQAEGPVVDLSGQCSILVNQRMMNFPIAITGLTLSN